MPTQAELTYGDGWFAEEHHHSRPFRWMGLASRCRITGLPSSGPALLRVTGGIWGNRAEAPRLSVTVNGCPAGTVTASADVGHCLFPIESAESLEVDLLLDRTFSVPGDGRALGLMVRSIEVLAGVDLGQPIDGEGWFDWEHDEYFPFRWMGTSARVFLAADLRRRGRFAQLPVCADCEDGEQVLTISARDTTLATLPLLKGWHVYDVPLVADPALKSEVIPPEPLWLTFSLNQLWPLDAHPEDARNLGVRVGPLEVHDDRRRNEFVRRFHAANQTVGATAGEKVGATREGQVAAAEGLGVIPLTEVGVAQEEQVWGQASAWPSAYRGLPVEGDGWFWTEYDEQGPFRWMAIESQLRITPQMRNGARYCVIPIFSSFRNLTQEIAVTAEGTVLRTIPLLKAWSAYSIELPPDGARDLLLTLRLNKIPPIASHPKDPRPLGARVGDISFHDDPARHARQEFMYTNAVRNQQELQAGATVLQSFPLMLGIDLYGKCNIKPACVYCLWDPMKALEGEHVDTPIDDRTLESYGDFYRGATQVVNCSFGEPLLHPRFSQILEFLAGSGKVAEISSNGQAFNANTVRALEGKPVHLYVSLDSATAGTYARLRNDRWHEIVTGLLFLRDARRRGHGWPRLNLVFMPMRANRQDLEVYFKLCRLVEADQMVLRPLLYLENPGMERDRGGYHFDYERELLGHDDLEAIFAECGRLARKYEVRVISQFDFGKIEADAIGTGRTNA